jgi:ferrous iron transport protein A
VSKIVCIATGGLTLRQILPLEFLRPGEEGRVYEIDGDRRLVVRLEEMGLRRGVDVRMVRPGSPCIVAFDNHRLSVRTDECAVVMVEVNGAGK